MSLVRRPSPAAQILASMAAGTFGGLFISHPALAFALALAAGAISAVARFRGLLWVLSVGLGLVHGSFARWIDASSCRGRLAVGPLHGVVVLEEPSLGRATVSALPLGMGCGGPLSVRFRPADRPLAGNVVEVEGRWIGRSGRWRVDGLLVVDRWSLRGQRPTMLRNLRNWLGRTIESLYGPRAGVISALMVGTRGTIDPGLTQAFARSGLVHLLSISGFHVGLIAGWIVLIGNLLEQRRLRSQLAAVVVVAAYVGFIGAPAPALRAATLAAIGLIEAWRQRAVGPGPLFALTALVVLLFDPWALVDLGAWLSVTALWGATTATRWSDRAISPAPGWRILAGSIGATLFTAPVAALALGNVSLIGIGLNIIGIPLAAIAVPGVLLTLLVAPITTGLAKSLAAGSGLALGLLEAVARGGAEVPGAALTMEPGLGPALVAALALVSALVIVGGRNTMIEAGRRLTWGVAPLPAVSLVVGIFSRPHTTNRLALHFLDVGQGDAALIQTPHQRWILVDAGPASAGWDAGARVIAPYLARHGVARLDLAILSHAHLDHYGGSDAIFRAVPTNLVLEPGEPLADPGYLEWLDRVEAAGASWRPGRAGARFEIDGVEFRIVHPDSAWSGWREDVNDDSIVLGVRMGRFDALFPGDAGFRAEESLRGRLGRVDVLKVGHHGSRTSSGEPFLAEIGARAAIVSSGVNRYGHPSPEALGRLAAAGADLWRTDRDGTVTVVVFDSTMRVSGRRRSVTYSIE